MIHNVKNVISPIPQVSRLACSPKGGGYVKPSTSMFPPLNPWAGRSSESGRGSYAVPGSNSGSEGRAA